MGDLTVLGVGAASAAPGGAAGTTTLQIVDPLNTSVILFDLNDPTGANNGLAGSVGTKIVSDFDIGSPTLQSTNVDAQDIDATYSAFSKRATATMKGSIIVQGSSYDNLASACGTLAQLLTQGCTIKFVISGSTNTYFVDALPSPTPALLAGGELAIYKVAALFQTKIDLTIVRQPYLRGAALTDSVNKLDNGTMIRDSDANGRPDNFSANGSPTVSISAVNQACRIQTTTSGHGIFQSGISVSVGTAYTVSAECKVATGSTRLSIEWRTGGGSTISTTDGTTYTGSGFTRISVTGTAPATAATALLLLYSTTATSDIYFRNAQFEAASSASPFRVKSETVNLDPATSGFSKMIPVYNPGTAPAPMTITTAFPDASTNVEAMDYFLATTDGIAGNHYLSDFLNGPYYAQAEANGNGWTLTAGTDTTLAGTADATFSPGSGTTGAVITHATDPTTYNTRITFTRTTLLDSLRGTHRVFAAVEPAAITYKHKLQLSWSAGTITRETNDEFLLDQTLNSAATRVLCDLGTIDIPESTSVTLGNFTMALATKMTGASAAAQDLRVDYLMIVPQANSAHVVATESETSALQSTTGDDLQVPKDLGAGDPTWVTGAVRGKTMRLNQVNEAAGVGSTTTGAFTGVTGGRHQVFTAVQPYNFIGTYKVEVANLTDNTVTTTQTYASSTGTSWSTLTEQIVTDTNAKVYQPRVTITSYTSGKIDVLGINVFTLSALAQNQQIRTDPGSTGLSRYAAERLDSSSQYVGALDADRVPFWIPPGLSLLWVEAYDVSVGGAELPHLNARTLTVTPTVYPRFWA